MTRGTRRERSTGRGTGRAHGNLARRSDGQAAACNLQADGLRCAKEKAVDRVDEPRREIDALGRITAGERVVRILLVARRLENLDLRPVRVEFVGEHHRQGRMDALAHFRVRHDGGDAVVRRNLEPDVEQRFVIVGDEVSDLVTAFATAHGNPEDNHAACRDAGRDESTTSPLTHSTFPCAVR